MGLQGTIKTSCSNGCEEDEYTVWSFVRGDSDTALREALLAGELNLQICSDCGRERLQAESDLNDDAEIAEFLAEELELSIYPVRRAYALERNLPRLIPCKGQKQKAFSRAAAAAGIKSLLSANGRLSGFRRWLEVLKKEKTAPPRGKAPKRRVLGQR